MPNLVICLTLLRFAFLRPRNPPTKHDVQWVKFKLLRYTVSGEPIEFYYKTFDGLNIDRTSETTDLGVVILDIANFAEQITNVAA